MNIQEKQKYHTHDIVVTEVGVIQQPQQIQVEQQHQTPSSGTIHEENKAGSEKEELKNYVIIHTTITTTDTLNVSLTKADVWIVDYTQEFEYQEENLPTVTGDPTAMEQNREYRQAQMQKIIQIRRE